MFDHKHYVPILKTKAGEIWSLLKMKPTFRTQMTPLLEIHKHRHKKGETPRPLGTHVSKVCDSIKKAWGTTNPFFVDTEWINSQSGTAAALTAAMDACRNRNLKAIPVIKMGYNEDAFDAARSATKKDGRGYLLRIDSEDAEAHVAINGIVEHLGVEKSKVHLLLDYREHPMNLVEDVSKLPSIEQWGTLTASSGAFPRTISVLPQRIWIDLPRQDWNAWMQSMAAGGLSRRPTFSDYATRCPGTGPGGGDPHVHLRYTRETKWLIYLNGTVQNGNADRMPSICRELITMYDGNNFSEGDKEIFRIAYQGDAEEEETGGAKEWVQWCINHHLTFAITQIHSHADF